MVLVPRECRREPKASAGTSALLAQTVVPAATRSGAERRRQALSFRAPGILER